VRLEGQPGHWRGYSDCGSRACIASYLIMLHDEEGWWLALQHWSKWALPMVIRRRPKPKHYRVHPTVKVAPSGVHVSLTQ
jgi:hypothetical protein